MSSPPTSPTLENLISLIADYAVREPEQIGMLDSFADLGFDSLDHTQLITECEDLFEIEIPEQDAAAATTVAALHDAILRAQDLAATPAPGTRIQDCGSGIDYGICRHCGQAHGHIIPIHGAPVSAGQ